LQIVTILGFAFIAVGMCGAIVALHREGTRS